ncbi:MAG: hypothetical protein KJZ78_06660, partial [Bryobacteraceae bacterium]|nr:hypothetical protein [Bryobacteraceae bacterium]
MARARYIRPQFFLHEDLAELEAWVRLMFIGLWTLADRAGRLPDRPRRIHASLFPYEAQIDVDGGLNALAERRFIQRYEVAGARYIQITGWAKHQTPHHQEVASSIPAPPGFEVNTEPAPKNPGGKVKLLEVTSEASPKNERSRTEPIRLDSISLTFDPFTGSDGERGNRLHEFLNAYPKKTNRDAATRAYLSLIETAEEHGRLMAG